MRATISAGWASFRRMGSARMSWCFSADGRTLAIANGGIETHPDFGRAELNIWQR